MADEVSRHGAGQCHGLHTVEEWNSYSGTAAFNNFGRRTGHRHTSVEASQGERPTPTFPSTPPADRHVQNFGDTFHSTLSPSSYLVAQFFTPLSVSAQVLIPASCKLTLRADCTQPGILRAPHDRSTCFEIKKRAELIFIPSLPKVTGLRGVLAS